jgi:UDP:flavonoid glycosyltransferase YjiC (YdhE family)
VRILFSFAGGPGHLRPLLPLARAARAAGHQVAVAAGGASVDSAAGTGFPVLRTSPARPRTRERLPLEVVDATAARAEFRQNFADRGARVRQPRLAAAIRDWRPDLLIRDEADFGGQLAAEQCGVPSAVVVVLACGGMLTPESTEPVRALRAELGLPAPAPEPVLAPVPPGLRDPRFPLPAGTLWFRPGPPPPVVDDPLVYFSLGTEFNTGAGDLYRRVLAGLSELDCDVLATVGVDLDPAEVGPVRPGVRVERFVPQDEVLPRCVLAVTHAGSGSLLGALAHGVPLLLLPLGADQPVNAARCAALGLGRVLDAMTVTPAEVHAAAAAVLADPGCRAAARGLAAEFAALPDPAAALTTLLTRLT